MTWTGKAVPRYNKRRKRLSLEVRRILNDVQAQILQDPHRGDPKRGALKKIRVEKFKAEHDQYLVGYEIVEKEHIVVFYDIGQHENFYRDLEKYLKTAR